jgi:hypothetical protein
MWTSLLNMLGKAGPTSGDSFTSLSAMGTPGRVQSFSDKTQVGQSLSVKYFLKYIAGMK